MHVLGVGTGFVHDGSAALIKNGAVVAAVEEERFDRVKHGIGYPYRAINYCLEEGGVSLEDLDYIAFNFKPFKKYRSDLWLNLKALFHRFESIKYSIYLGTTAMYPFLFTLKEAEKIKMETSGKKRVQFVDHHLCHAASCFYPSPFEEAAILTLDNKGEGISASFNIGKCNKIERIKEIQLPHSLGMLYLAFTFYLGFKSGDEYKVMGLASYGEPAFYDVLKDILQITPGGEFRINPDYFDYVPEGIFSRKFYDKLGDPRKKGEKIEERHINIASSLQKRLEDVALSMVKWLYEKTKMRNLCMAGGVTLNSVMNGVIEKKGPFENIFVQPAASDIGTSLGAALELYFRKSVEPIRVPMEHAYLGTGYSDEEIEDALKLAKLKYKRMEDVAADTAKLIAGGKIVGWFQTRMEWGPRALGARSIIADPRKKEMKDVVNRWVKHRENFRPFAPSILVERCHEYFDCNHPSPYMLFVYDVLEAKKNEIQAITHVDGTARVHTVNKKDNPLYYKLIQEFEQLTGVPVILNTSFNIMGEPIVRTPSEAIRCFYATGMDYLVIGPYLLSK